MALSDSDLMMIENLTYALGDKNPASSHNMKPLSACRTVGEYLNQFDDGLLKELDESTGKYEGEISGQEWAAMIRYMKSENKQEIKELIIQETTEKCVCFLNPNDNDSAIVAFRGTKGGDEWVDNVEGFNQADTPAQLEAYEYIDNLPYERITVVGHSKGGNKAQYVAIRCENVERCVSVDGQGFSQEFIDKYGPLIEKRSDNITNYSLSTDFVHILMYELPGAKHIYINGGNDVASVKENHSPNSVFEYYIDDDGEWHIKADENSNAYLPITSENPSLTMLHKFTAFVLNNASDAEKEKIVEFLAPLFKGLFLNGESKWSKEEIIAHIKEHREEFVLILAYLLKYIKLNDLHADDIVALIKSLGLYDLLDNEILVIIGIIGWEVVIKEITDGEEDKIIKKLLEIVSAKTGFDITGIWKEAEEKYKELEHIKNDKKDAEIVKIDYSNKAYSVIMEAVNCFENITLPNASTWYNYTENSWFNKISTALVIRCINTYIENISETNSEWKKKVISRFDEIRSIDDKYAERLRNVNAKAASLHEKITSIF